MHPVNETTNSGQLARACLAAFVAGRAVGGIEHIVRANLGNRVNHENPDETRIGKGREGSRANRANPRKPAFARARLAAPRGMMEK